jgi:hypothetical protein
MFNIHNPEDPQKGLFGCMPKPMMDMSLRMPHLVSSPPSHVQVGKERANGEEKQKSGQVPEVGPTRPVYETALCFTFGLVFK